MVFLVFGTAKKLQSKFLKTALEKVKRGIA